jgi:hypothetical protein
MISPADIGASVNERKTSIGIFLEYGGLTPFSTAQVQVSGSMGCVRLGRDPHNAALYNLKPEPYAVENGVKPSYSIT